MGLMFACPHAVLVDGAHTVGAMPLAVPSMLCDFYTSNLHKWACTAKGCAFLWVAPSEQHRVLPSVTSHGYGLVRFTPCDSSDGLLPWPSFQHRHTMLLWALDMPL